MDHVQNFIAKQHNAMPHALAECITIPGAENVGAVWGTVIDSVAMSTSYSCFLQTGFFFYIRRPLVI